MANTVLVLRTCNKDLTSYGYFQWPKSGPVECPPPDPNNPKVHWDPTPKCGNGLHGFLWGEGDGFLASRSPFALWLVIEVLESDIVDLGGKVKFPKGNVVFCGDREGAIHYIVENGGAEKAIMHRRHIVGSHEKAYSGWKGHSEAGHWGRAITGKSGRAIAGTKGLAVAEDYGQAQAGPEGIAQVGRNGLAIAGSSGTVMGNLGSRLVIIGNGKRVYGDIQPLGTLLPDTPYQVRNGVLTPKEG